MVADVRGDLTASRERSLAQRERTLALYASEVAERSRRDDDQTKQERAMLEKDRAALDSSKQDLSRRERELNARLHAVEEWEAALREREEALHRLGSRTDLQQLAVSRASAEAARQRAGSVQRDKAASGSTVAGAEEEATKDEQVQRDVPYAVARAAAAGAAAAADLQLEASRLDVSYGIEEEGVYYEEGELYYTPAAGEVAALGSLADGGGVADEVADAVGMPAAEDAAAVEEEWFDGDDDDDDGWMAVRDEQTGIVYYWHQPTGETSWEPPHAAPRAAPTAGACCGLDDGGSSASDAPVGGMVGAPSSSRGSTPRRVIVVAPAEKPRAQPRAQPAAAPPAGGPRRRAEPKWAQQSNALRSAMASARAGGGDVALVDDANDGRVECLHCRRRFSQAAAERHIPQCQKLKTQPRAAVKMKV